MEKDSLKTKYSLGIALLLLGLILAIGGSNQNNTSLQNNSLSKEPIQIQGFSSRGDLGLSRIPKKIIIPDLSIDLDIERSKIINGYWQVHEESAGWGEGSGIPGEKGNQVVFAHAREGLFLPIKDIEKGMIVYIFTESNWYSYQVIEIKQVYPTQTQVIAPSEHEILTLYTCSGFNDSKRLIVVAERTNI